MTAGPLYLGFPGGSVVRMQGTREDPLEKEMITLSSILAGKSHGQRSLVGYSPWGCKGVGHDLVTKQQPLYLALSVL